MQYCLMLNLLVFTLCVTGCTGSNNHNYPQESQTPVATAIITAPSGTDLDATAGVPYTFTVRISGVNGTGSFTGSFLTVNGTDISGLSITFGSLIPTGTSFEFDVTGTLSGPFVPTSFTLSNVTIFIEYTETGVLILNNSTSFVVSIPPLPPIPTATLYGIINPTTAFCSGCELTSLYTIDPATGAATLVGPTGLSLAALASANNRLYAATIDNIDETYLVELDPATGAVLDTIGLIDSLQFGTCGHVSDMTFDSTNGIMYCVSRFCNGPDGRLGTIDLTTGARTDIGVFSGNPSFSVSFLTIAYDVSTDTVYVADGSRNLFTIDDLTTDPVVLTQVDVDGENTLANTESYLAISFNPLTNELFAAHDDDSGELVSINVVTAEGTLLGPVLGATTNTIEGLDWQLD